LLEEGLFVVLFVLFG